MKEFVKSCMDAIRDEAKRSGVRWAALLAVIIAGVLIVLAVPLTIRDIYWFFRGEDRP